MMEKKKLLFFLYNRWYDPLLQSNIILFVKELTTLKTYDIAIITFEDPKYLMSNDELQKLKADLKARNIILHTLKWHSGKNLFLKFTDLLVGFFTVFNLVLFKGYNRVISLGSIAGSFIYIYSLILRYRYYLYQYEPHSEYAIDNSIWSKNSAQFKVLNWLEKKAAKNASVISSGSNYMGERLNKLGFKAKFFKLTSVVDDAKFNFFNEKRNLIRNQYNISLESKLFIYPGKLGDLYCTCDQIVKLIKSYVEMDAKIHFLIISPQFKGLINLIEEAKLLDRCTIIAAVPHNELPALLSAADIGIVAVNPGPSKKFITNIKVGEYLCSGLPYLICEGVSEDYIIAKKHKVGIVIKSFTEIEYKESYKHLNELLNEPKDLIVNRCRNIGIEFRGFANQNAQFIKAISYL